MPTSESQQSGADDRNVVYRVGQFTLDATQRILLLNDQKIPLKPKTFDVLEVLAAHVNQVVSKNDIIDAVWHDAFVEEGNLAVYISTLRKILSSAGDRTVFIETIPKVGYRLVNENSDLEQEAVAESFAPIVPGSNQPDRPSQATGRSARPRVILVAAGIVIILLIAAFLFMSQKRGLAMGEGSNVSDRKSQFTWERQECPRISPTNNLEVGGCDDPVTAFSLSSNPNGNWAYGYSPKDDTSHFTLFEKANHNNHFASPEVPVDFWNRPDDWHPLILKNTSNVVIVIQGAVVVPPTMFEMHPGPDGQRSVLRWTAPADGDYRIQGQFRGINGSGYTRTDALVVENGSTVRFSADIEGFNFEHPFDLTFIGKRGGTVDFSVGYGSDRDYAGDSTGFSAIITTISLEGVSK